MRKTSSTKPRGAASGADWLTGEWLEMLCVDGVRRSMDLRAPRGTGAAAAAGIAVSSARLLATGAGGRQLTSERLVTRMVKGFPRASWEKESGRRNEALDCRVYARAAATIYGLDRFEERHWRRMEEALARTVERDGDQPASARLSSVRPPARQVIQSGYMAR